MTIGELEAALDMPRANIRFYEQEGFIHPRRGANNYRDYTEEDADTLRKVKLLRQLGLSLEEIRHWRGGGQSWTGRDRCAAPCGRTGWSLPP